ncbi:hypothetical protein RGQ15_09630 [Paracoccus sp. MBLB3053]|uniref:Uncharacterized protein n=1 Tax=Paracoccus aurantius TaxID=3073814 RepID=A0ABU2HS19_9RHOB|nr:hypothetical protein [Paracoccus sp. MBLB3053]MDS9467827.1 hypothetical protein [Paracoccus sp. MBLB3053]
MKSLQFLGVAQAARYGSLPEKLSAPNPLKEAVLEPLRERNAVFDHFFYDIGVLTTDEVEMLAPWYAKEGALILVQPSDIGGLTVWAHFDAFQADAAATPCDCLAVAGVGSSALGTAAFGRNVADAIGKPVLAVVSGYGLSDLAAEALGGFFWFGWMNSLRHAFESLDVATRISPSSLEYSTGSISSAIRGSLDVKTVHALCAQTDISLLVGHSKGNLVISEALYMLSELAPQRSKAMGKQGRIATISAKIQMPRDWHDVIDIMGDMDGFGLLNSRLDIPTDHRVTGAWHHTNTELPFHLPVTRALSAAMAG